jgi:hypothetical protein
VALALGRRPARAAGAPAATLARAAGAAPSRARGEVRGGRFVAGMVGEQFALPKRSGAAPCAAFGGGGGVVSRRPIHEPGRDRGPPVLASLRRRAG